MTVPWVARFVSICSVIVTTIATPAELRAQSTLIPITTRQAMVFEHGGKYLYISCSDGFVRRYNLSTNQIDNSYNLGGSLNGLDIAPDDSFLLVAQDNTNATQGFFQKVDLATGTITNIPYALDPVYGDGGGWDVAIASNGLAFASTEYPDSWTWLHQIDLATNSVTTRTDAPGGNGQLFAPVEINRAGDGSVLYFMEGDISDGPVFTYTAATNTFSSALETSYYLSGVIGDASAAVNGNGTLIATDMPRLFWLPPHASLDTGNDFTFRHDFNEIDGGVAFDGQTDTVYGVNSTAGQIIAYDTKTFAEKFRLNIGEALGSPPFAPRFGAGNFVVTPDGRYLALATPSGIRIFSASNGFVAPPPTPTLATRRDIVFDHSGQFAYITTSDGFVERYDLSNGTLQIVSNLGGSLYGVDIAPDDSFLLIAQGNCGIAEGAFQKLDLVSGIITNITYSRSAYDPYEIGAWSVAIASNGLAFGTAIFNGSGWVPLHQIDLTANTSSIRNDVPGSNGTAVNGATMIHRSADYTRLCFGEGVLDFFTYDATADRFAPHIVNDYFDASSGFAVNRDGSLVATRFTTHSVIDTLPDMKFVHPFARTDGGIAFDATANIFYAVNSGSDQIVAYDSNNFNEKFRIDVGEALQSNNTREFGTGTLMTSPDGQHLALETTSGVRFYTVPTSAPSPTPPPLTNPRDMVFDHSGAYLYIDDDTGWVHRYNVATQQLDAHYNVGGEPDGIDIAPDDSFLLVAQGIGGLTQGSFEKIDLTTGAVSNIAYDYAEWYQQDLPWDLAIAPNGKAIAATSWNVRQVDPFTNSAPVRSDATIDPYLEADVFRSADRSLFCFLDAETSAGSIATYTAATDTFGPESASSIYNTTGAVNRNGSLVARGSGTGVYLETTPNFSVLHYFSGLDSGIAFDAVHDYLYGVSTANDQIIAYDTNTFAEQFRVTIGEHVPYNAGSIRFGTGRLVASQDGRSLALITPTAVRVYDVSSPLRTTAMPVISPGSETFRPSVTVTLSCSTPGATIYYTVNGASPTTTSAVYPPATPKKGKKKAAGIKITYTATVRAMAVAPGYTQSGIASATFTKSPKKGH